MLVFVRMVWCWCRSEKCVVVRFITSSTDAAAAAAAAAAAYDVITRHMTGLRGDVPDGRAG
jgi:hypothetical protein